MAKRAVRARKELTEEDQKELVLNIQKSLNKANDDEESFVFEAFDDHDFANNQKVKIKDLLPVVPDALSATEIIELRNTEIRLMERTFVHSQKERIQFGNHLLQRYRSALPITKVMQEFWFDLEKNEEKARKILVERVESTVMWNNFFIHIKGVAERLAGSLMAEVGYISKFDTVSKLLAYFGIVPNYWIAKCANHGDSHTLMMSSNTRTTCPVKIRGNEDEIDPNTGLKMKNNKGEVKKKLSECGCELTYTEHIENRAPKRAKGIHYLFNTNGKTTVYKCCLQFLMNKNPTYTKVFNDEKERLHKMVISRFVVPIKEETNSPRLKEISKTEGISVESLKIKYDNIEKLIDTKSDQKNSLKKDQSRARDKLKKEKYSIEVIAAQEVKDNEIIKSINDELKQIRGTLPAKYVTTREMHMRMNKKEGSGIEGYLTPKHIYMRALRKTQKIFVENMYRVWRVTEGLPIRKPYAFDQLGHSTDIMIYPWNEFFKNFNYETNKTIYKDKEMDWKEFINTVEVKK